MSIQYIFNPFTGNFDAINTGSAPPVSFTTFDFANNQTSPADVTGFLADSSSFNRFIAEVSFQRDSSGSSIFVEAQDSAWYSNLGTAFDSGVQSVVVQLDDKAIFGGQYSNFNGNSRTGIVRLNPDGTEDTAFYTNLGTGFNGVITAVTVDNNTGDIYIAGNFSTFNGNSRSRLVKLDSSGIEDTTFASNIGTGFIQDTTGIRLLVQSNGQLLLGGSFSIFNGNVRSRILRLNSDGTEDTSFYTTLVTTTGFNGDVKALAQLSTGDLLIGGGFNDLNGNSRPYLVKTDISGNDDSTFASNMGTGFTSDVNDLDINSTDQIGVCGNAFTFNGNSCKSVVKLNSDGTEDTAFTTNMGIGVDSSHVAYTLDFQSDDKLVLGGEFIAFNGNTRFQIVRIDDTGVEDATWYSNMTIGTGFNGSIASLKCASDGSAVCGGGFSTLNGITKNNAIKFGYTSSVAAFELNNIQTIKGVYSSADDQWTIAIFDPLGDDPEMGLTMTSAGQLQYTSSDLTGSTINQMKFSLEAF